MPVELKVSTDRKEVLVDITDQVAEKLADAKVEDGICILFSPHTTCGLVINENADPAVRKDIVVGINQFLPHNKLGEYRHAEGNSPAHIKSSLVGQHLMILIEKGHLVLGTWQGIFLAEFDGPRERKVLVKIMKGS